VATAGEEVAATPVAVAVTAIGVVALEGARGGAAVDRVVEDDDDDDDDDDDELDLDPPGSPLVVRVKTNASSANSARIRGSGTLPKLLRLPLFIPLPTCRT
jgi:hypothetical protein